MIKLSIAIALVVAGLMLIVHAGSSHSIRFDWVTEPVAAFLGAFFGVLVVFAVAAVGLMLDMRRVQRRIYGDRGKFE